MKKIEIFLVCMLLWATGLAAQDIPAEYCSAEGIVVDAETGETLPMVQIYFIDPNSSAGKVQTSIGTTSDMDGNFKIGNSQGYTSMYFQMIGYKTELVTIRKGQEKKDMKVKLKPDVYGLQDIVVTPKHQKRDYKRRGNPAVELIKNVIANKEKYTQLDEERYTANSYSRMSFALDNFYPNFNKGFWKTFNFIEKYIDTTGVYPSLTVSIREHLSREYYQRKPHREKKIVEKKRIFGVEDVVGSAMFQENVNAIFKDIDLNEDNMNLLFNRFVSPLNSKIATTFYQYYIMDTIPVDGYQCIDLAFVPVNSESFGFTGHLYIVNDSTYKIKKYSINIPPDINLNFVSNFSIEHSYRQLGEEAGKQAGLWTPDRTSTYAKFTIFGKRGMLARQTRIYTGWDFDTAIPARTFSSTASDILGDSATVRVPSAYWTNLRPEPLTVHETAVSDLVEEFEANPLFQRLALTVNALSSGFVPTARIERQDSSKWDFGPIFNTYSWNPLEGSRIRIGGTTMPSLSKRCFLQGYVAYGFGDKRPKYNLTGIFCFNDHKWHAYDDDIHHLKLRVQYDVEEPGQNTEVMDRDIIFNSIPFSKPTMGQYQYVFHAGAEYEKQWKNGIDLRAGFDYSYSEAAGSLSLDRVSRLGDEYGAYFTNSFKGYVCYDGYLAFRYRPGKPIPRDRQGVESTLSMENDQPTFKAIHHVGYLDDRRTGGKGFLYNTTELQFDDRFWFSAFGCLDMRLMTGIVWQQVPFTKLFAPSTTTSIFLGTRSFNLMRPSEFLFDEYISLHTTYYFKGWILNRIPGINRLKLRGVVSFSCIYGGLTEKNNPYSQQGNGLYTFPNNYEREVGTNNYISGSTCSPIGKMPYMELTAGFENIFRIIRIDYVRRLTYNDYELPNGGRRRIPGWGRNGVKVTIKIAL